MLKLREDFILDISKLSYMRRPNCEVPVAITQRVETTKGNRTVTRFLLSSGHQEATREEVWYLCRPGHRHPNSLRLGRLTDDMFRQYTSRHSVGT